MWLTYFSELSTVPPKFDKRIEELNKKVKELEQKPEFKSFSCLDFRISASELNKAIFNLQNGKSPGLDMIGNELLKTAQTYLNPCLVKLFNAVFTSGMYPQIWSEGYITPIFKAENPKLPQNYRGITICNSIGKVFNSILNNRLLR
jgi:hypothetical protein